MRDGTKGTDLRERRTRARAHARPNPAARRRGLTLIELVMVLAILAALASMAVPILTDLSHEASEKVTRATMRRVQDAILNRYMPDMAWNAELMRQVPYLATDPIERRAIAKGLPGPLPDTQSPAAARQFFPQLYYLFINPRTNNSLSDDADRPAWHGPYFAADRGGFPGIDPGTAAARGITNLDGIAASPTDPTPVGDPTVLDAWGHALVIRLFEDVIDTPGGTAVDRAYLVSAGPDGKIDVRVEETTRLLVSGDDEVLPLVSLP